MTGFFLVKRSRIELDTLRPHGFKILLEIIARQPRRLTINEAPFTFGNRYAGESKATFSEGIRFIHQLIGLRFGRMARFAVIGAVGAVVNLAIVALLIGFELNYLVAAAIAAEITIVGNYFVQERFVFCDLASFGGSRWRRFIKSVGFNNVEAALRLPLIFLFVSYLGVGSIPATAITLVIAFLGRFAFHSLVIYAPPRTPRGGRSRVAGSRSGTAENVVRFDSD